MQINEGEELFNKRGWTISYPHEKPYNPTILLLGVYPGETDTQAEEDMYKNIHNNNGHKYPKTGGGRNPSIINKNCIAIQCNES